MRRLYAVVVIVLLVAGCVPPRPTPTVSPIPVPNEPVTPAPVKPALYQYNLPNANFEGAFVHPESSIQEFTVAKDWLPVWDDKHDCQAGTVGCDIPCPSNCQRPDGQCRGSDPGCWWARPEYRAAYGPDYHNLRVHSGQWAQYAFVYGRMGNFGIWRKIQVKPGSVVTFTIWMSAVQIFDGADARLSHMHPARQAELAAAWGVTQTKCPDDPFCAWTASDIPSYLKDTNPRHTEPNPSMGLRIGIVPSGTFTGSVIGGTTNLSGVTWGDSGESWDTWTKFTVTATATAGSVDILATCSPRWTHSYPSNDCAFDDAEVWVQEQELYTVYLPMVRK